MTIQKVGHVPFDSSRRYRTLLPPSGIRLLNNVYRNFNDFIKQYMGSKDLELVDLEAGIEEGFETPIVLSIGLSISGKLTIL